MQLCVVFLFFFFKQKTAYDMLRSLVGSEMCIRDRYYNELNEKDKYGAGVSYYDEENGDLYFRFNKYPTCLLYTSDAADDLICVDLGGRRIIKKKKQIKLNYQ